MDGGRKASELEVYEVGAARFSLLAVRLQR